MDGEMKNKKYLMNQPTRVHSYTKLCKSDSPRTHTSPTSSLRKFPHSQRHDQKHRRNGRLRRSGSPVTMVICGESVESKGDADEDGNGGESSSSSSSSLSWCLGDSDGMESDTTDGSGTGSSGEALTGGDDYDEEDMVLGSGRDGVRYVNGECSGQPGSVNRGECESVRDGSEGARPPGEDVAASRLHAGRGFTASERQRCRGGHDTVRIGSTKKLSVINNSLSDYINVNEKFCYSSVNKISDVNDRILSPVHKSTPNLLRSEPFGVTSSASHPDRITDRLSGVECASGDDTSPRGDATRRRGGVRDQQVPLKGSDSLPQLSHKYRSLHSILSKINRTISESSDSGKLSKGCVKSESNFLANGGDSYRLLADPGDATRGRGRGAPSRSEDENESLIGDQSNVVIRPRGGGGGGGGERRDGKTRWSCRRPVEIMPSLRSLVTRRGRGGTSKAEEAVVASAPPPPPLVTTPPTPTSGSCTSLNDPVIGRDEGPTIKKCDTMYALTDFFRTDSSLQIEPMQAINRLRVPPNGFGGSMSRMCSRCSSLLSMASSSRYSINTTGSGFVPCSPSSHEAAPEPNMLCKLCLLEVPLSQSMEINQCGCVFCRDCMKLYVEFEIQEGAYDISCPDAQCHKQGIVTINEVELLVATQMMERYMRFRLNHEVDLDRNRTWCPRAGCETVCNICPREKCSPTSVHCPTCDSDFCSNCKNPWHRGLTCEENSRKLAREGHTDFMEPGIPFGSDLIKCCPVCNVPIEKDEGCAQMLCKRCKHLFCWYCLASLDDDYLLRHYDKGPCKNKLGHSRASVIWHRTQVIGIFAGFGILLLVASPLLLVAAPCIVCCKCRVCSGTKMDPDEDLPEDSGT